MRCPGSARRNGKGKRANSVPEDTLPGTIPGSLGQVQGREKKRKAGRTRNRCCSRAWNRPAGPRGSQAGRNRAAAPRPIARKPWNWPRRSNTTSCWPVHEPRAVDGQLRFLADPGRAEQTAECLAAESHPRRRPAFAKGDLIRARPEYEKGLVAGARCSMTRSSTRWSTTSVSAAT